MKLWQKDKSSLKEIERFTVGKDQEMDMFLAPFDVLGSLAHITMLESIGLLTAQELKVLSAELKDIYKHIAAGDFKVEEGVEDIHSQVELELTKRCGEIGKKIHSGRSRNDQVLVDIKLFLRAEIRNVVAEVQPLFDLLLEQSEKHKAHLLPGYTHLQLAMPSSFGLWFGAYAESLVDDVITLQAAYRVANKNPLGSAAGYGSSFPLNRTMTTVLLGFESLNYNVVYAQMGRGKTERIVASALGNIAATLAKLSMDACLFLNQNFGFVSFPDELTTGSSIMPHKKNPDVFELIRARCNQLQALPNDIALATANLPSGYHRDMQLLKEVLFPAIQNLKDCLRMAHLMLSNIKVQENILADEKYKFLFSVEEVNKLVLSGTPFRDAYKKVGMDIELGQYHPAAMVQHTHEGSIGNLCLPEIRQAMQQAVSSFQFETVDVKLEALVRG
ncbi:argininosuccinate lyase [Chryseolinea lacunae]|uniref:Argininosuccinate lyase n=1 Tax=Chryseolinea lacunae TaxID=2801331 RepID=A0ABS1KUB5_9BACT|nr:argininosuccinate lyase [Chryseolinea lacunae]MBL0742783.1 argininosuccinate lyase [Chryseolinea lacunae]